MQHKKIRLHTADVSQKDRHGFQRADLYGFLFVFFLAMILRGIYLYEIKGAHFFFMLMGDAELYDIWAREILDQGWLGKEGFFQAPFYPYFLAVVYGIFGKNLLIVRWVQIILGSFSCVFIAGAGKYFFSRKIGILSGLLIAVYPGAIFFDLLIQKAVLGLFFMSALLFLLGRVSVFIRSSTWFVIGVILGCLILVRENALIFTVVILAWLFGYFRTEKWKKLILWSMLFILGSAVITSPVAIRNKLVGGELVLTTSNLGYNLYVGNSKHATGTYAALIWGRGDWRYERDDYTQLAEKALGRQLSPSEISRYWTKKAIDSITSDYLSWVRLMVKKWFLIWNAVEASDTESQYAYSDFSFLLKGLGYFLHFGTIFPLSILGFWASWEHRSRLWLLYLLLIVYAIGITPFFVFARYRQAMIAVLTMFAAAGLLAGFRALLEREYRTLFVSLVIVTLSGAIANWEIIPKQNISATTYYNWAVGFENQNNTETAIEYYLKAVELNPNYAMAYHNLGVVFCNQRNFSEGIKHFKQALRVKPDLLTTLNNLGVALYFEGKLDEALGYLKQVLRVDPEHDVQVYYNIACILARQHKTGESLKWLQQAIDKGYRNWDNIRTDEDLDNIRMTPGYREILEKNM